MARRLSALALAGAMLFLVELGRAEERAVPGHVALEDVERGVWSFDQLRQAGKVLFRAHFTIEDGAGRPGATGNPSPTRRPLNTAPGFLRTAGPDANSCEGCHNQPIVGGAGEFAVNVFAGTTSREPVILSIDPGFSAERGTPPMQGSGAIELLAREMTRELHAIRADAIAQARRTGEPVRRELLAKGVSFGFITGQPDGNYGMNEIDGIDRDLVVRPWGQKGVVTSLRTFTINAMNQHHGIEADERFGLRLTGSADFDRDGIAEELTEGDVTALVVFQASLNVPGRVVPADPARRKQAERGEALFAQLQCTSCHRPEMPLESPIFSEPGPYNLEGTLKVPEVKPYTFDLTRDIPAPRLERGRDGKVTVHAYTDLKRHRICDQERPFFCNETLVQGFAPTDRFITARLWNAGNTAPYGHRGDLTTLREAILNHGAEARRARLLFEDLPRQDQDAVVEFLKTLQILPEGSAPVVEETVEPPLPYARTAPQTVATIHSGGGER
jgi:hypothetical protein